MLRDTKKYTKQELHIVQTMLEVHLRQQQLERERKAETKTRCYQTGKWTLKVVFNEIEAF